ncbi:DUF4190 domain-containing protein [Alkalihalobacillus pseudalcaliphilus]|uniref:DUF4190 domain-containing protein n=1 Tax=Alkalihalobacillus pseudalcaliphilus TaxID=79884 RepID=UPI00064DA0B2|nr:DUF4190 domain-containing protein [Alkalihalobacillus pseudalcaliphilus]KMK78065.1 hypothetical protein AB990_01030 [Alkalihalobacillus pseudalcaliphilus]
MEETRVVVQAQESNGLAVSALVLGIIGLVLFWVPFIPYPLAILALIFGFIGLKKQVKKGLAITGIVTGAVTLLLKLLFWIGFVGML